MLRIYGADSGATTLFERVIEVGRAEGIAFDLHKQARAPNTELAHRVVRFTRSTTPTMKGEPRCARGS
jgi:predicted DsbA family dithiol-disulfide isomerase